MTLAPRLFRDRPDLLLVMDRERRDLSPGLDHLTVNPVIIPRHDPEIITGETQRRLNAGPTSQMVAQLCEHQSHCLFRTKRISVDIKIE